MKKVFCYIAFALIAVLLLVELNRIFTPKWDDDLYTTYVFDGLYEEDSLDVVFLGTSQVLCGISPMELYEKYGIKAYNCASGAQSMVATYYWTREVIQKKHPDVLVVDIYCIFDDSLSSDESIHQALDYMHFGPNKLMAARDVTQIYDIDSDVMSFALPYLRYHNRWKELEEKDFTYQFKDKSFYNKGCISDSDWSSITVTPVDKMEKKKMAPESYLSEYLRKILEYCQKTNTKVVLTKVPLNAMPWEHHELVQSIADEYNVPFINMMESDKLKEAGINEDTDFEGLAHLNMMGAIKTTRYLGDYLVENYPEVLSDAETNLKDERWQKELREYQSERDDYLNKINEAVKSNTND